MALIVFAVKRQRQCLRRKRRGLSEPLLLDASREAARGAAFGTVEAQGAATQVQTVHI